MTRILMKKEVESGNGLHARSKVKDAVAAILEMPAVIGKRPKLVAGKARQYHRC